jgi:hypothetical protein
MRARGWYANLLRFDRRKCLLLTHAGMLSSMFEPCARAASLRRPQQLVTMLIGRELAHEGRPATTFGAPWAGANRGQDRRSQRPGVRMNDMAVLCGHPELPVPKVLEVGDAFDGAYAISVRHYGTNLEDVRPDQSDVAGPMLASLLGALFRVPKSPDLPGTRGHLVAACPGEPGSVTAWLTTRRSRFTAGEQPSARRATSTGSSGLVKLASAALSTPAPSGATWSTGTCSTPTSW